MLRYMCAFLDRKHIRKYLPWAPSQWWLFNFSGILKKGDMSEGMAALCLFVFWFAVPETMVTRLGLAKAFFDFPWRVGLIFCFPHHLLDIIRKSGSIDFDKFQLQPHQHPGWNSTTINKKWCFRLDDDTFLLGKLLKHRKPTSKTWAISWTSRVRTAEQRPPRKCTHRSTGRLCWGTELRDERPKGYTLEQLRGRRRGWEFLGWEICPDFSD